MATTLRIRSVASTRDAGRLTGERKEVLASVGDPALDPAIDRFCCELSRHYWKRRTFGSDGSVGADAVFDAADMFELLTHALELQLRGLADLGWKFWIDGVEQPDATVYAPSSVDGSLEGYAERMTRTLGERDYTLLLPNPHLYDLDFWLGARRVLCCLYRYTGMPFGWADTALFMGRYARTPFGVHAGQMDVLTFPVAGKKTFRLWSPEYIATHPNMHESVAYDEHVSNSYTLSCATGGIGYWPSREWHIAEGDGSFSAAWNIGVWHHPDERHLVRRLCDLIVSGQHGQDVGDSSREQLLASLPWEGSIPALPTQWRGIGEQIAAVASSQAFADAMTCEWMWLASTCGFKDIPAQTAGLRPGIKDAVRGIRGAPILCSRLGSQLCVAVNGHVCSAPTGLGIEQIVRSLNAGAELRIAEICEIGAAFADGTGGPEREALLSLLQRLSGARGLVVVRPR